MVHSVVLAQVANATSSLPCNMKDYMEHYYIVEVTNTLTTDFCNFCNIALTEGIYIYIYNNIIFIISVVKLTYAVNQGIVN